MKRISRRLGGDMSVLLCGLHAATAVELWADPQLPAVPGLELWLDAASEAARYRRG